MSDQKVILNHEVSINKWESTFGKENIIVKLYKNVDNTITETFSILGFNTIDSKIKLVNEELPILNPEQLILLKHCKNLINIDHLEILKKELTFQLAIINRFCLRNYEKKYSTNTLNQITILQKNILIKLLCLIHTTRTKMKTNGTNLTYLRMGISIK